MSRVKHTHTHSWQHHCTSCTQHLFGAFTNTHTDGVGSTPSVGHQIVLLTLKNSLVKTHKHSANLYFCPVDHASVSLNQQARYINTLTNYKIVTTSADLPLRQRIWQVVVQISNYHRSQCTIRALGWLITMIMTLLQRSAGYCFLTDFMNVIMHIPK